MWEILYNIIIMPIEMVIEVIFSIMYRYFQDSGIAILFVSLVVQLMVLPLYKRADYLQSIEREKQKRMEPWVKHIKKTFKGDEKMMMLQTYYREVEYNPFSMLKGSLSLVLQVPFFIAAYHFLSKLVVLRGEGFLLISDLGKADQLISVNGLSVNLLPILMTAINVISGYIYTKGFPIKEKLQLYIMAVLFLILLYKSPSGLVLYWTMNNVFSLFKNIVARYGKKPKRIKKNNISENINQKKINGCFIPTILLLLILFGLSIPMSVIVSSPMEFIGPNVGPIELLVYSFCVYFGIFVVWCGLLYYMLSQQGRKNFVTILVCVGILGTINFLFYGKNYGLIGTDFVYSNFKQERIGIVLVNTAVLCGVLVGIIILLRLKPSIINIVIKAALVSLLAIVIVEGTTIKEDLKDAEIIQNNNEIPDGGQVIKLSKNGKNVVVIMLDRAVSQYIPFFLDEKPELKDMYDGFVYYPNTVSYGMGTNSTTPSLFGGYEYTPKKINERKNELMKNKHDEALLVMPTMFAEQGYNVVVTDPPYAGYSEIPDLSIYNNINNVSAYNFQGYFSDNINTYSDEFDEHQKRNMIMYSIMRISPLFAQNIIYNEGNYQAVAPSTIYQPTFADWYTILEHLNGMTEIQDNDSNNVLIMQNSTTHEPVLFDSEYVPLTVEISINIDDKELEGKHCRFSSDDQIKWYQTNMAALLKVGQWLDYLKENDVYDNTRIIIVSDHGWPTYQFDDNRFIDDYTIDRYNPLLLYKDFNASGFEISDEFMTNADVSILATNNLYEAINPFTGNKIFEMGDKSQPIIVSGSYEWRIENGYQFNVSDDEWLQVKDNIFDLSNWEKYVE